jgi:hypothetical protein
MLRYAITALALIGFISLAAQAPAATAPRGPKVRLEMVAGDSSLLPTLISALQGHVQIDSLAPVALRASFSDPRAVPVEGEPSTVGIKMDLTLKSVHLASGKITSEKVIALEGKGPNAGIARRVALRKLSSTHIDIQTWGRLYNAEFISFFRNNCDTLLATAQAAAKANEYLKAFGLASSIPELVTCSKDAAAKANEYYEGYQRSQCGVHLQKAGDAAKAGKIDLALDDLSLIDPQAPCVKDVMLLMDTIAMNLPADQLPPRFATVRQTFQQKPQWEAARKQIRYALIERHIAMVRIRRD